MDWNKAKKVVILILIVLNVGLFGLNYIDDRKYYLSQAQEDAVVSVINQNGISLNTDIVKEFKPMRQLSVIIPSLETDKLRKIFFDKDENTKITVEFNKTILKSDTKTLTIENNTVEYECKKGTNDISDFNIKTAQAEATRFMKSLGQEWARFKADDNVIEDRDCFIFEYYEDFKGNKVFSSNNKITVNKTGVIKLTGSYYEAKTFVGEKKSICSADEALFTFLQEVKSNGSSEGIIITKMEMGYDFQETAEIAEGKQLKLVPCYHIYTENQQMPYVINAYTNEMKQ